MSKNQSLSLRTQWLGARLKAARLAAGLTLKEAADQLQLVDTTLSRFEKGVVRVRRPYVTEMIDFYSISNRRERDALTRLNDDAWRKDWWDGDSTGFGMDFIDYTWLESRAARICVFEPMIIHGLLQTDSYARAVTVEGLDPKTPQARIDSLVDVRMKRQHILGRDHPTELSIVFEEAPLHRVIGSSATTKRQLEALLTFNERTNIDVRVLPKRRGWHPGLDGPFTFIEMPDPYPDVAYIETLVGCHFLEEEEKVERYRRAYDRLHAEAIGPKDTARLIQNLVKELK